MARASGRGGRTAPAGRRRSRRAPASVRQGVAGTVGAVRGAGAAVVAGDRPYIAVVLSLLVLAGLMLAGPVDRFLDGRARVELLQRQHDALSAEVDRLEARRDDLQDLGEIELLAREELGLVRPGERPYVVVTPEAERPQVVPTTEVPEGDATWYRRLWDSVLGLLPG